jgi:hypothetical protein
MPFRSLVAAAAVLCATAALAAPPQLPVTPASVELISARPFTLGEPLPIPGRPDLERSHEGLLLVVAAEPSLVWPRQTAQPVLYAGETLALRANHGWPAGRLVVGVIGTKTLDGLRLWFGSPGLPERADASLIAEERELADAAGLVAFSELAIERALASGGEALELDDAAELQPLITELLNEHDPNRPGARR